MKIVYVYADNRQEWNSSEWRCAVPARAINRTRRHSAELLSLDDFARDTPASQAACDHADVIIVQRNLFDSILAVIQHWKARDKTVIADFDDAYHLMTTSNASYPFWTQGLIRHPGGATQKMYPLPLTQFKMGLRLVHAATVPSKRLADDWQSYTEMFYLPNYIELEKYQIALPEPHEGVIIGWGGSLSHLQSFTGSGVATALKRVCHARPQVKVMICGSDRRIVDQLAIPPQQMIVQPWVPYTDWPRSLAQFDIGLAPLHGAYDDRRSWIKVLEYLVMKIPWVASESPAYEELRPYGWLVKNASNAWERVLLDMIDHLDNYKREAAGEPFLFGIGQNIDEHVDQILSVYMGIYERVAGNAAEFSLRNF